MTFKFSARVGEIIKGNLARGEGGRFISADELQAKQDAIKARILRLIRAGIIPPTAGDPEQLAAAQGDVDFSSFVEGKIDQVGTLKPPSKPKKKRKRQSAKQAKKSSSKKSSKRSEKRKAEKAEDKISKEQEQADNIANVQSSLPELSDLIAYRDGEAVDSEKLNSLVSKGLLEVGVDGTIRMNPSGSKLVRAAKRGDTRAAQDAISEGSERITKAQERITDKQELSDRYTERIAELDTDIAEAGAAIQENVSQITGAQNELSSNQQAQGQAQSDLQSTLQTIAGNLASGALDQASADKLIQQAKQSTTSKIAKLQKQSDTIRNRVNRLNERDTRLRDSLQFKRDLQDRFRDRRETVNEDIADLQRRYQIESTEGLFERIARLSNEAQKNKEADEVFTKYHQTVNMSASELERWSETECSKKASLDRSPITRNLRLLRKKKSDWTGNDIKDANRTISFVSRMRGAEQGKPASDGCPSKRDISLKNWAYNPGKTKSSGVFDWVRKSITTYRQQLRRLVRQYYSGQMTEQQFIDEFINLLAREFESAWLSESPFNSIDQLPPAQQSELFDQINQQIPFIENFANDIDPAKPIGPYLSRVILWTRRFDEIAIRARIMTDPEAHYEWILGATDIHCTSCLALDKIVKTGQYWLDKQVLPQVANATYLACQGYNCKCELRKTTKLVTEGPLPVVIP